MVKKVFTLIITFIILTCSYFSITSLATTLGEQKQEVEENKKNAEQRFYELFLGA